MTEPTPENSLPVIVNRGDGPKISGTRITVYDVYYYLECGRTAKEIGEILRLSAKQVEVALQYIKEHEAAVREVHLAVEERNARGNPPEIEEKLRGVRERMQTWLEERRRQKAQEAHGERHNRGC